MSNETRHTAEILVHNPHHNKNNIRAGLIGYEACSKKK